MEVAVLAIIFGSIFGVFYLYFSSRNKERLALIEKGVDASIFMKGKQHAAPIWKVIILNLALLLMGIGAGIIIGGVFTEALNLNNEIAMPGTIFLCAGAGLFIGFNMTKNLDKE